MFEASAAMQSFTALWRWQRSNRERWAVFSFGFRNVSHKLVARSIACSIPLPGMKNEGGDITQSDIGP